MVREVGVYIRHARLQAPLVIQEGQHDHTA